MTIPLLPTSYAEAIIAALAQKKAHRVLRFVTNDGPTEEFYVVDGRKHIERLACLVCLSVPRVDYAASDVDNLCSVTLRCECGPRVSLSIARESFDRARGAMTSVLSSWWNAATDRKGHPNDLGAAGGFLLTAAAVDTLMGGLAAPSEGEADALP